jgi:rhamnose transport system permease protein
LLITWLRVPAIIATLGTMSVFRGLIFVVSGNRTIEASDLPAGLISLSQTSPVIIPWIVVLALLVVGVMHFFLRYTRTGRCFYAIGGNAQAAQLRGVPVERTVLLSFIITGALSGLAGVMAASRFGFVYPSSIGVGFELSVIAATIIGGTNVAGGSGSVPGTVLGCVLLGVIQNALIISGLSVYWQFAIYGAIILVAVSTDSLIRQGVSRGEGGH